jgi:hypothetical protein
VILSPKWERTTGMTPRRSSRRRVAKGWDAFATPVPGDVISCMEELGIEVLRVTGDEAQAKCPAHFERTGKEDRHPSFSVNTEAGVFSCFSCGFRGPFVVLVEYMLEQGDRDAAVGWVRARGGIERVKRVLGESRGLKLMTLDTTLQINEASLALFLDPPAEALAKRNISLASAQHYGVLWDIYQSRWITPIRDPDTGKLWGWQAKNERYFRNVPNEVTKSKTLFGLEQFVQDPAILVESPLDVLRIHTAGVEGGLSSFGAGVSTDQMKLIQTVSDVLIAGLDNDKDGTTYSRWLKDTYGHKMVLKFLNYADFDEDIKDPGDMTNEQIRHSISTAIPSNLVRF